jgi:hypothetical protein
MDVQRKGDSEVAGKTEGSEVEFNGNFKFVENVESRSYDGCVGSASSEFA